MYIYPPRQNKRPGRFYSQFCRAKGSKLKLLGGNHNVKKVDDTVSLAHSSRLVYTDKTNKKIGWFFKPLPSAEGMVSHLHCPFFSRERGPKLGIRNHVA